MKELFSVEYLTPDEMVIKIKNNSKMTLILSVKPTKPKRAYRDFLMIPANSYTILDQVKLDFKNISFSFE